MRFDEYVQHDATSLADLVRRGEVSPAELLDAALERADDPHVEKEVLRGSQGLPLLRLSPRGKLVQHERVLQYLEIFRISHKIPIYLNYY